MIERKSRASTWTESPHHGKRGANGRRLCLECGKELSEKRKRFTFCSDECRRHREVKCHPARARAYVKARDHGICARCGLDCEALDDAVKDFGLSYGANWWRPNGLSQTELAIRWLVDQGFVQSRIAYSGWMSTWQAHHKTAVVEGGGQCDLDGYETLCWRCHAEETKELAARMVAAEGGGRP